MKNESLNTLVVGFSDDYLQRVIFNLNKSKEVQVKKVITNSPDLYLESLKLNSDDVISTDQFNYIEKIKNIKIHNFDIPNKNTFDAFSENEKVFMNMSDRLSYFPISVKERQEIFYKLFLFWFAELKKGEIDLILFDSTPHFCWDIVLYFVAEKLNIPIIYIERTLIDGKILLLDKFNNLPTIDNHFLEFKTKQELENEYGLSFFELLYKESVWIKYSKEINSRVTEKSIEIKKNLKKIKHFLNSVKSFLFVKIKKKKSCFYLNHQPNKFAELFYKLQHTRHNNRLKRFYLRHTTNSLTSNYCIFYLQLQPERTTLPMADIFENQLLSIIMLSKCLPKGMTLFVKEHPRQFDNKRFTLKSRHFRNIDFYKELLLINNIKLLDLNIKNEDVIKGAKFVATGTGSVGWEALLQGVPTIVFGHPWFKGCSSCFYVSSKEEIKAALEKINMLDKDLVITSLYKYYIFLNEHLINAANENRYLSASDLTIEENIENLSDGILLRIRQHVKEKKINPVSTFES